MTLLRRLAWAALGLGFLQVVFGAIVRITGSGMGCGDHWPTCQGYLFPPLHRPDLIIEVTHRYIAAGLTVTVLALFLTALARRQAPGVGGRGGVLRAATLAIGLVLTAAVLGAVTVKLSLNPFVIVTHLSIAMALLATLVSAVMRAGGLGARTAEPGTVPMRTLRAVGAGAVLTFIVLIFGALTANLPDAAVACRSFPLCGRPADMPAFAAHIQLTHRIFAYLLFFHLLGVAIATDKRGLPRSLVRATWTAFCLAIVQVLIAGAMIGLRLPAPLRSMHQATGTLIWLSIATATLLAWRMRGEQRSRRSALGARQAMGMDVAAESGAAEAGTVRVVSGSSLAAAIPAEEEATEERLAALEPSVAENVSPFDVGRAPVPDEAEPTVRDPEPTAEEADRSQPVTEAPPPAECRAPSAERVVPPTIAVIIARGADF